MYQMVTTYTDGFTKVENGTELSEILGAAGIYYNDPEFESCYVYDITKNKLIVSIT